MELFMTRLYNYCDGIIYDKMAYIITVKKKMIFLFGLLLNLEIY